jgi:predicted lipoprotein with Yx(FWY)xxD motif
MQAMTATGNPAPPALRTSGMRPRITALAAVLAAVVTLLVAPPASAKVPTTISLGTVAPYGKVLVGPNGHTLYTFDSDKGTKSACTSGCDTAWPALVAAKPTAGMGVTAAKVGKAKGQKPNHVTYDGHLLYQFAGDSAAGTAAGASSMWHPVTAKGAKAN